MSSSKQEQAGITAPHPAKKRPLTPTEEAGPSNPEKRRKLYPIFAKADAQDEHATFRWISPALGPNHTCLHGVNKEPAASSKVAAFDLDGCLIESHFKQPKSPLAFKWWRPNIPTKLQELHEAGYAIVIFTNQALRGSNAVKEWKKKLPVIAAALPDVPFRIFAATAKDGFRKPMPGMWYELEHIFSHEKIRIDKASSFFVGDAAGRKGDHAATDRKWALNLGIPFFTPEEYFLKLPAAPYTLTGFHVSSLPDLPAYTPTSTPLCHDHSLEGTASSPEVVLFVGYPAMGKSSFYRKHFESAGYVHVNQDTLRTRDKCIQAVEQAIHSDRSCIVDNTNRDASTRKHYIDLAQRLGVPIRCIVFNGSLELAWHNNLYRAYNLPETLASTEPKRELLPYSAFTSFQAKYEEPELSEGFSEIKKVNWVFEGDEEARRRWSMWLQIDGK